MEQKPSQSSNQTYQSIHQLALEHIDTGVWVIDDHWRFVYLNLVMEHMTKRHRKSLVGRSILEEESWFVRGSTDLVKKIQAVIDAKSACGYENISHWRGHNNKIFQRGTIHPLIASSGRCRGVMVTIEEVNEAVEGRKRIRQLERTVKAIARLQAARHHENQVALTQSLLDELSGWPSIDLASFVFADRKTGELAVKISRGVMTTDMTDVLSSLFDDEAAVIVKEKQTYIGTLETPEQSLEIAAIPLEADHATIGILMVARKGVPFSGAETETLLTVAQTFSTSLNERHLADENRSYEVKHHLVMKSASDGLKVRHVAQRREKQVIALNEVSRVSHSSFDLADMLTRSLETVAKVLGWETAAGIYLLDKPRNVLALVASRNLPEGSCCKKTEIPVEFGACGLCARTKELVVLNGDASAEMCRQVDDNKAALTIAVPLTAKSEALGVMFLYPEIVFHMSSFEKEMLKTLGEQLGATIKGFEVQQKITELSSTDEETGAFNFRRYIEQIQAEFQRAKRYAEPFSIVNVLYDIRKPQAADGAEFDDRLLETIAQALKKSTRSTDTIYRYGQHEFAVLLASTDKDGAACFIKRLKEVLAREAKKYGPEVSVRIGIGSVACPQDTEDEMELIDFASRLARTELGYSEPRGLEEMGEQDGLSPETRPHYFTDNDFNI